MFTHLLEHLQKYTVSHLSPEEKKEKKNGIIAITIVVGFFAALFFITAIGVHYSYGQEQIQEITAKIVPFEEKEIPELRTENTQTFIVDDHTQKMRIYFNPQYENINNNWYEKEYIPTNGIETIETQIPSKSVFNWNWINTAYAATDIASIAAVTFLHAQEGLHDTNYGTNAYTCVGNVSPASSYLRGIIKQTLPSPGYGEITAIDLKLYRSSCAGSAGYNSELHELTRTDWVESEATWHNYKSGSTWTSAGGDFSGTIIDTNVISSSCSSWDTYGIYGPNSTNPLTKTWGDTISVILKSSSEASTANNYIYYDSDDATDQTKRPYIEITYTPLTITSINPTSGKLGDTIQLTGTGFTSTATMSLWDSHTLYTMDNYAYTDTTEVEAHVPDGLTHNTYYNVIYTNTYGTATSSQTFHYHNNEGIAADNSRYTTILLIFISTFAIFDFMRRIFIKK